MEIDYSVIIRTTGKAGQKYEKLLSSISNLIPKPKEVIVVLPDGFDLPKEQLGNETFLFCKKGMVIQRLFGIQNCKTDYALVTDDDIAFQSDFVQKLYDAVKDGEYGISAGPLPEFFPEKGKAAFASAIVGSAISGGMHFYNKVLRTTGYQYKRDIDFTKHEFLQTQSAPWTCFFIDVNAFNKIHFEDELWLDSHGYATHDDTTMFYKAWLYGCKSAIVTDARYEHLDAGTSKIKNQKNMIYSNGFNTYVFWYKFIYSQQSNLFFRGWSRICIWYRTTMEKMYLFLKTKAGKMSKEDASGYKRGIESARHGTF